MGGASSHVREQESSSCSISHTQSLAIAAVGHSCHQWHLLMVAVGSLPVGVRACVSVCACVCVHACACMW